MCALLVREGLQKTDEDLRYVGFRIPPKFVVGYGLDFAEKYRNLPYVCVFEGDGSSSARRRPPGSLLGSMKRPSRATIGYILLGAIALFVASQFLGRDEKPEELTLTEFHDAVDDGEVATATIKDKSHEVTGELQRRHRSTRSRSRRSTPTSWTQEIGDADPPIELEVDQQEDSIWTSLLFSLLPMIILFGLFLFVLNSMQGGGSRVMQFGKAKARQVSKDEPKVTFADVAGCDEAVEELQEIKEFLQSPARFQAIGAKIPKGVLLYGPPGTGKTLLARAVAGEAGVPFFSISGSDFVEMFVGVGASRVRDLFEQAKQAAPSIIFVDEIDAVGRHRGAGLGGGHDEREQTLNQLLVEMDGFDARTGVILIAATNRPDILDPALLRPGRFDRQIVVDRPDLEGRKAILDGARQGQAARAERAPRRAGPAHPRLHRRRPRQPHERGGAARRPPRPAARSAMPSSRPPSTACMAGPERKNRIMSEKEKLTIAYHEGGHALVGPRARRAPTRSTRSRSSPGAGRWAGRWRCPPRTSTSAPAASSSDSMAMLLGGRTAEELVFGEITTGASDDIERCTEIARGDGHRSTA